MLAVTLFSLVATVLASSASVQVPLGSSYHRQAEHLPATVLGDRDVVEWSLDKVPNPNTTDHLVFDTVHSLLQRWSNTRLYKGHNIIPGTIPKGTLLYHGRGHKELPPGPEWVATDPEHSYIFCIYHQQECWQLTLATTRPLKVVYFDGGSAVSRAYGSMDTQDLLVWGTLNEPKHEMQRIQGLCEWGKRFGVDGFVRMEVDFEVMLCDFTSGVSVVSFVKLASRLAASQPRTSAESISFEAVKAGSWHNRFPGEMRIHLDLPGLVSFYDTQLAPSLVAIRAGQERWDHRVRGVSGEDLSAAKSRLEAALMRSEGLSSGIDWETLFQVIVDRYAQRLELTRYILNSSTTEPSDIFELVNKHNLSSGSSVPTDPSDKINLEWTIPVYKLCAVTHTHSMETESDSMTDAEKLLLQAVRGTSREICRVVTKMWAAGVLAGVDPLLDTKESVNIDGLTQLWSTWSGDLNRLMAWLDWSVWVKCNPECAPEEICQLHPLPLLFVPIVWRPGSHDRPGPEGPTSSSLRTMIVEGPVGVTEVVPPRPKCIRQAGLYDL